MTPSGKRFAQMSVWVRHEQRELAEICLWELGAIGLEIRDATTIVPASSETGVTLLASFDDEALAKRALEVTSQDYQAELSLVAEANWAVEWRRGFGPREVGARLLLEPTWERASCSERIVVTIDPENAFGSGDHATTRLVLEVLDQRVAGGERILDVGTGSGVLAIAALRLGASSAVAIDVDRDAVEVARRNTILNEVDRRCAVSMASLSQIDGTFEVVVANIETQPLVEMADLLAARVAPEGSLVLSGILHDEIGTVVDAFPGMALLERRVEEPWCALVMECATS